MMSRMARSSRAVALLGIAGLLAAVLGPCVLLLHLAHDHHGERSAAPVVALLHGHTHDPGTPDHDHISAQPRAVPGSRASSLRPFLVIAAVPAASLTSFPREAAAERPLRGAPPPGIATIVLRI